MKTRYNWGIMGAGIIARKMADALGREKRSMLLSIGSKDPERARAFAEETGCPRHGSYRELLEDPEIDIVYVASTHNFHYESAKAALEKGKHVLVEKAFTVNAQQAKDLAALARSNNCFLMEAMWTRFLPSWREMRRIVQEGEIGKPGFLELNFGKFIPPCFERRLNDPALAGGASLDLGVYALSFVYYLLGEYPETVASHCRKNEEGVDALASYQLSFPSGASAQITVSFDLWTESRAALFGSTGAIIFPGFADGSSFTLLRHDGGNEVLEEEDLDFEQEENGFVYEAAECIDCISAGRLESPIMPLEESVEILRLIDTMREQWGLRYEADR